MPEPEVRHYREQHSDFCISHQRLRRIRRSSKKRGNVVQRHRLPTGHERERKEENLREIEQFLLRFVNPQCPSRKLSDGEVEWNWVIAPLFWSGQWPSGLHDFVRGYCLFSPGHQILLEMKLHHHSGRRDAVLLACAFHVPPSYLAVPSRDG